MLITKNRGYKRQYLYDGSGVFDSLGDFLKRLLSSALAKHATSVALDVGKSAATTLGKKLADKAVDKLLTPKSKRILNKITDTADLDAKQQNTIAIQDLVRRMNGSGLKVVK